jgi:hypothetical protein
MLIELREYRIIPGRVREFLALLEAEGLPIQIAHLGEPIGYFTTDVGDVNEVVHMWAFTNAADREKRRANMNADARWSAFLPKGAAFVQVMRSRLLRPAPFSPIIRNPEE